MTELTTHLASWQALGAFFGVVVLFGFLPGFTLRLMIRLYPRGHVRRDQLLADMYELPRHKRWFFVAEQCETVLFEGLPARRRKWVSRRADARQRRDLDLKLYRVEQAVRQQKLNIANGEIMLPPTEDELVEVLIEPAVMRELEQQVLGALDGMPPSPRRQAALNRLQEAAQEHLRQKAFARQLWRAHNETVRHAKVRLREVEKDLRELVELATRHGLRPPRF